MACMWRVTPSAGCLLRCQVSQVSRGVTTQRLTTTTPLRCGALMMNMNAPTLTQHNNVTVPRRGILSYIKVTTPIGERAKEFNTQVHFHAKKNKWRAALDLLEDMRQSGTTVNPNTYKAVMNSCTRMRRPDVAISLHEIMMKRDGYGEDKKVEEALQTAKNAVVENQSEEMTVEVVQATTNKGNDKESKKAAKKKARAASKAAQMAAKAK
eukprot:TRINITY_DN10800_c0_g1_i1.p1 TRINITY_DN10800_c0_g1~~TRINITY_DN10800_c0_g1_i1.p1  ORF type:complete len:220 (-),score=64.40 TRINITY_DN10800_c0_g1_i1:87-716(-)